MLEKCLLWISSRLLETSTFPAMLLGESIRNTVRRFGASIPRYICNYAFSEFEELVYIYAFYKLLLIHTLRVYLLKKYTYLLTYLFHKNNEGHFHIKAKYYPLSVRCLYTLLLCLTDIFKQQKKKIKKKYKILLGAFVFKQWTKKKKT